MASTKLTKKQAQRLLSDADSKIRKFMFASYGRAPTVLGFQLNRNYLQDMDKISKILQKYYDALEKK